MQNKLTTLDASLIKNSGLITSLKTDLAINETTSQGREKELAQMQARYDVLLQEHASIKSLLDAEKKSSSEAVDLLSVTKKRLIEADERCRELTEKTSL